MIHSLRLAVVLVVIGIASGRSAAEGRSAEDVADQIDAFMSVFLTTTASMNPTSDICDRIGSDRDLSVEVRMARSLIATYKKEPIDGEPFQNIVKALVNQEIEVSKLMARREEFVADMVQIVERLCADKVLVTDLKELAYNGQLTPELAGRVWAIAAAIQTHSNEELTKARAARRAAILDYVKKNSDKVRAIAVYSPSKRVVDSRRKVREVLEAAKPGR